MTVTFLLMDTRVSSAGLQDLADTGRNAALAPFYAAAGRSYPAFVSLVLLPALLARRRPACRGWCAPAPRLTWWVPLPPSQAFRRRSLRTSWAAARLFVNYAAVLGYVLGLLVVLVFRAKRPAAT